ncbi:MAG: TAXI family TRAP transporter solute-binding subunit [Mariprofundus sp.]|nr:TAXI family TRAP transporter solute-binding subunit [Mariprofundus sp.]
MSTDKLKIYIPAMILAVLGFGIAWQFVDPAPPTILTFTAGQKGGAYYAYAERYRDYLKQRGITVNILESAGSVENVQRLKTGKADIAFAQSGIANPDEQDMQSLGSMYVEPLWVFLRRGLDIHFLRELKGKRIAIGLKGSGTQALAMQLLAANGIDGGTAILSSMPTATAANALMQGGLDALFIVSAETSASVQALLSSDDARMLNIERAEAYTRRFDALTSVLLPQGALNLALNIPARDTQMLAATATLMVNENMHPALQSLVMQASSAIHASSSLFSRAGTFPTPRHAGFALSKTADHYYKSGPPFLQRFLPFWAATLMDRLKIMLLPFIALLLPLFKVLPPLYRWRIRSRIYRWYEELGQIDAELGDGDTTTLLDDLNRIESEIRKVHVPLSYAQELYDLRLHLALVRDLIEKGKTEKGKP